MNKMPTSLAIPSRKKKGLLRLVGGYVAPFYYTAEVVAEGTPMVLLKVEDKMRAAVQGASEGTNVAGLSMQETYDDSAYGQLAGYHFANDTRQRLDGNPIGLLTGLGYASTNNYWGNVAIGDIGAVGASGRLVKWQNGTNDGDKIPGIVFESAGSNGTTHVRIAFDLSLTAVRKAS